MAEQKRKSQAEKAATAAKSKKSAGGKSNSSKKSGTSKQTEAAVEQETAFPVRLITAGICLALFILFLAIFLEPDGWLTQLVESVLLGIIGRMGFIVSIPALLYLFFIQAFSFKRPVLMRSICVIVFVLLCGCISHLTLCPENPQIRFELISELYNGGINGTTGGLLCGGLAMLLRWLCGRVISYIVLTVAAILTLLGAMQITIPSIVRAVRNRPRADWEDEEYEDKPEPASIVVNHIAAKRIQYVENRRRLKEDKACIDIPLEDEQEAAPRLKAKSQNPKTAELMRQIERDVTDPVAAAGVPVRNVTEDELAAPDVGIPQKQPAIASEPDGIPLEMPAFDSESTIQAAPQVETACLPAREKVTAKDARESAAQVSQEIAETEAAEKPEYCFPPIDLLRLPVDGTADGTNEMRENSRRLNETLQSFKIEAHIINVTRGPSVTRYEVELEKGVRLNKLTTAADDIALSLGASGVRIAAVPGKISVVGIEVPNKAVTTVTLREVIDSNEFAKAKSKSTFAVGKDIGGNCIVGNIAKLPHMLIAGTTGSGKSVCMNSIIISLLYKAGPEDVKLIMVDPKMVELGIYNGIPHLLIPVVTDPKKAAGSLQWAVTEMMRRYRAMSDAGVRDLESYNSIVESQEMEGEKLPQVVVIIDELADLMLVAAKEVEESICRIAQMGRAAGIHLIIATQRPSADVITGLMKANIPSRIAFAVASAMESRIILDTQGAEKLVDRKSVV